MNTESVFYRLRTQKGLSQEALAEQVYVTRQAVSRWENGETVPNTETLIRLSKLFDVSINTLLGSPRKLFCRWTTRPSAENPTAPSTRNTANGAIRTGNLFIKVWMS